MNIVLQAALDQGDIEVTIEIEIEKDRIADTTPALLQESLSRMIVEPPTLSECEALIRKARA